METNNFEFIVSNFYLIKSSKLLSLVQVSHKIGFLFALSIPIPQALSSAPGMLEDEYL